MISLTHMHAPPRRLVIVTGPPRGGTTVVGEMLGFAPRMATLHEPMNIDTGDRAITRPYEVPGTDGISEADFAALVDRVMHRRLRLRPGTFRGEPAWRRAVKRVVGGRSVISQRRAMLRGAIDTLVWKDPFAVFALDAIQRQVPNSVAVLCYRPPLALAASFKRMQWRADFRPILRRLGQDPAGFELPAGVDPNSPVVSAAFLWRQIFGQIVSNHAVNPASSRILFDIDAAIADPLHAYEWLYAQCSVPFSQQARDRISARYQQRSDRQEPPKGSAHVRNRDLGSINNYWRKVLAQEEIELVNGICGPLVEQIGERSRA